MYLTVVWYIGSRTRSLVYERVASTTGFVSQYLVYFPSDTTLANVTYFLFSRLVRYAAAITLL